MSTATIARQGVLADHSGQVSRFSADSLSEQVASHVRGEIESGTVTLKLPSEVALAQQYGASRVTARVAIRHLADAGLVVSRHGRGTFITAQPTS